MNNPINIAAESSRSKGRFIAIALGTALASTALVGCTVKNAPAASVSANQAQKALAKGKSSKAMDHAEAAVLAAPRDASYRTMLGATYMEAGRFQSAADAFADAMTLGDDNPRTALSLALAHIATGDQAAALSVLSQWRNRIDAVDLGLALALAGQPEQGTHILANAVRGGANTPKARQNLAYAYALQGNWAAARLMASADVPADQLDARIAEWARVARPEQTQDRVAALLQVPVVADDGQPHYLALDNMPGAQQLAAEAAAIVPNAAIEANGELPAMAGADIAAPEAIVSVDVPPQNAPVPGAPRKFDNAFVAAAPREVSVVESNGEAMRYVSRPVVAEAPPSVPSPRPAQRPAAPVIAANGTHLVQLGSFSSEKRARIAWDIYAKRYSNLDQYQMVITKAVVRGKTYYRVSAGGFAKTAAASMCGRVKSSGHGCIAWADGSPLPGAVDRGYRMARR